MTKPIKKLTTLGQSLWYDNIQRKLLENGELKAMIERGDIRGVTSNPTIFQNAIAKTNDYDAALIPLAWAGWDAEKIFWQLAIEDIQEACDLFRPLYEETKGGDGLCESLKSARILRMTPKARSHRQRTLAACGPPESDGENPRHQRRYSCHSPIDCGGHQYQHHAHLFAGSLRRSDGCLHLAALKIASRNERSHSTDCIGCFVLCLACGYKDRSAPS